MSLHGHATSNSNLFANEQPIEFVANSGDKTDAVEGHFFVPENRNNPNTRNIRINYVRFPAKGNAKGAPIVYLSGGPGGSGIGTAKWRRFPLFESLREFGDVIALDQRGTGQSEQMEECVSSEIVPITEVVPASQIKQKYVNAANECFAIWQEMGADVYGYTTVQNALDINALREHLKAEKVSLWGISYGSHLALSAMKLFPEKIEKVIIASAEGLDQTVKLPSMTDQYFEKIQDVIEQQPLKQEVPDLTGLIKRVHQKLDSSPMSLTFTLPDGTQTPMLYQTYHMQMLASMLIADPSSYLKMLIDIYVDLDNNNTDTLSQILQRGVFKNEPIKFRLMPLAMDVASGISAHRLAQVKTQAKTSLLGDKLNFPMPLLNKFDAKLDLGDEFREHPKSSIPTLLLTGTLDGRTYPDSQLDAVKGLSNLTQVKVKYAGHNLYTSSPLVLERMKAFLADRKVDSANIELALPNLSN